LAAGFLGKWNIDQVRFAREQMAPAEAVPSGAQVEDRPKLRGQRVQFRESALLETILEHLDEGILTPAASACPNGLFDEKVRN